jgi:hypothetical protein
VVRAATFINSGSKWFRHFAVDAMSGMDRDRFCKYESGAAKAKKCKLREEFVKTQKGALDKYFPKKAVKQEDDFDLVLDSSVACVAKTDNDKSDNDSNEPLTALSSLRTPRTLKLEAVKVAILKIFLQRIIYAQRSQKTSTIRVIGNM